MQLEPLERAFGYVFARRELLQQALTHRSFGTPHNERLEFLGDSVLNCVVAAALFSRFTNLREGELSRLRAGLVRQECLFRVAQSLTLGKYLRLGEGEVKSGGAGRPSILADALEAIFGAMYLDRGFSEAQTVVLRLYQPLIDGIDPDKANKDPKTTLQELLQGDRLSLPQYQLKETRGGAHMQEFEVECRIPELGIVVTGTGSSRRIAEQEAAQRAVELIAATRTQ